MCAAAHTIVITGYGTNCEEECAFAAQESGSDKTDIVHFSDIIAERYRLSDYNFLVFPGGFLDGDDLGAAQAASMRWKHSKTVSGAPLPDELKTFLSSGGLIMGICNGFQLLVKLGLLPALGGRYFERQVSLGHNESARYEDRWCHLSVNTKSPSVFTAGLTELYMPVRHGEGKIVPKNAGILQGLMAHNLVPLHYADAETGEATMEYPFNPNGSPLGIAGLCDPSGRILGLMPHPEAYNNATNHPAWTRGEKATMGLALFENAIRYLKKAS